MPQCTCDSSPREAYCEIHGFRREEPGGYIHLPPAAPSPITHPPHYTSHPSGIEAWTIAEAFSYHIGTAIAYLWRAEHKNGIEDLRKAIQHIEREILRLEKGRETASSGPTPCP